MTDPRFTLPESPELLARAEAVARQRQADTRDALRPLVGDVIDAAIPAWENCAATARRYAIAAEAHILRDLTRPASYDAAIRWLAELLGEPESPGWWLHHAASGYWFLCHEIGPATDHPLHAVPAAITDPREALVLALTAALEARR